MSVSVAIAAWGHAQSFQDKWTDEQHLQEWTGGQMSNTNKNGVAGYEGKRRVRV